MSDEFESERTATRDEAAAILRDVADGVAGGSLRFGRDDDEALTIDVPDDVEVEIEFEIEDDEASVEIELEWPDSTVEDEASAAEAAEDVHAENAEGAEGTHVENAEEAEDPHAEEAEGAEDARVETVDSPVGPADPRQSLAHFEVFLDRGDEWRWRLVHRNGNVIATGGEGYTRKHNALKGLRSVMRNSPDAEVREDSGR